MCRTYGAGTGAVTALADVSIGFAAGAFTAIMGPSGSGKSTLLQCAAGLERPDSGMIWIAGTELTRLNERRRTLLRRAHVGFVFQSFNLLPSLTAEQNVGLPARLAGRRVSRTDIRSALREVGLAGREHRYPTELSGGQQQRVAIARAVVNRPSVLFADEPTGALDSQTSRDVLSMLRALVDTRGQTIIMVTHDPIAAARADRVVFFADGRPIEELVDPTSGSVLDHMTRLEAAAC
ncbi:ABC transporter ATP-binding protein [Rugosimonospora acidiphila]|uniref:ABC transporter ATP-binding protein n=1 Tax=Rugosimonospora acidiphila TaxID=556531 RepID=A0ABP9SQY6_9ACTN